MVGIHDVNLDGVTVGTCQVEKEGLYYRLICRCAIAYREKYNLFFHSVDRKFNLGILIPINHGCSLTVRVPIKKFGQNKGQFYIAKKENERLYDLEEPENIAFILKALPVLRARHVGKRLCVYVIKDQAQD